jgi:hypothetical protein
MKTSNDNYKNGCTKIIANTRTLLAANALAAEDFVAEGDAAEPVELLVWLLAALLPCAIEDEPAAGVVVAAAAVVTVAVAAAPAGAEAVPSPVGEALFAWVSCDGS